MQAERKLLCGWKEICDYIGISRLLLIRRHYPIYDCDKATHQGYGVCAYADELEAHRKALRHGGDQRRKEVLVRRSGLAPCGSGRDYPESDEVLKCKI